VSALDALSAAQAAGVELSLDDGDIVVEALKLPVDVVELLRAVKPDLMRILAAREAARATLVSKPPPDCWEDRWTEALRGLRRFVGEGWRGRGALMGWTKDELYRVPTVWSRIDLTGAALLIGDRRGSP
jgi:hypothetical protein